MPIEVHSLHDVSVDLLSGTLALRERVGEVYWKRRDPIIEDRMLWRAQTFRHVMHVLPGQSILEIGCGDGSFSRAREQEAVGRAAKAQREAERQREREAHRQ